MFSLRAIRKKTGTERGRTSTRMNTATGGETFGEGKMARMNTATGRETFGEGKMVKCKGAQGSVDHSGRGGELPEDAGIYHHALQAFEVDPGNSSKRCAAEKLTAPFRGTQRHQRPSDYKGWVD
jgi:hypothetical protein